MRKNKNPFMSAIWLAVIILAAVGLYKHFHIRNFQVISPGVLYTSGQPQGMDYTRLLYKYHIATFVNLRFAEEHRENNWYNEEVAWMRSSGVKYIEMPMEKNIAADDIPDTENCKKFLDIMSQSANLPVLLHDSNGKRRVSYLAAVWMLKSGNFNLQQTIEKVRQIKDRAPTEQEIAFLQSIAK